MEKDFNVVVLESCWFKIGVLTSFFKNKFTIAGQISDDFANNDGIVANSGEIGSVFMNAIYIIIIPYGIQLTKNVT